MALKAYDVTVGGRPTTLLLSDEDARAHGLHVPAHRAPEAEAPAPEAEAPEAAPVVDEPEAKAHTPANKTRTPANKGGNAR
ncbi:hypothetical protein [Mycolicibacter minnesotensis]